MENACLRRSSSFMLVLTALVVAGCGRSAGTDAIKEAPRVTVAHPVVRSLVDEDDYNGWLEASQTVNVRARVRGHIQKIGFKDGDMVQQGQLLFELDPRPFQAAVDEALAQVKALEAQKVAADKNAARAGGPGQGEGRGHVGIRTDRGRRPVLHGPHCCENASGGEVQIGPGILAITAPIAGRIGRAMLTEGNLVNAGGSDPVLATIVAADPIYVDFNVDERAMQRYQEIGAGRQGKDKQQSLREQKIPFPSASTRKRGFRIRASSCLPTTNTPGAPARSWSAASLRTLTAGFIPAPASGCGSR